MTEFALGSIFIRTNGGVQGEPTGHVIKGHKHNFDHVALFITGKWRAIKGDTMIERQAPFFLLIDKDVFHEFTVLEGPAISYCVFSHRREDGTVSETWTGWEDAYAASEPHPEAA